MEVDYSPLAQGLIGIAAAVITVATPILTASLHRRFSVANTADRAAQLDTALKSVAADGYRLAVVGGLDLATKPGQDAAVRAALVSYIARTPDFDSSFGPVSAKDLHDKVLARLGALMAADPNISAGNGVPPPPPSPVPP